MKTFICLITVAGSTPPAGYFAVLFPVAAVAISVAVVALLGSAWVLYELSNAPEGFEDARGFHSRPRHRRKGDRPRVTILRPRIAT